MYHHHRVHKIEYIRGRETEVPHGRISEPDAVQDIVSQVRDVFNMRVPEEAVVHFSETYNLAEDIAIQRDDVPLTVRSLDEEEVEAVDNQIIQEAILHNTKTISDPQEL